MSRPQVITYNHNDRKERASVLVKHFGQYMDEARSILDVGCSENDLKNIFGDIVFGIDIAGKPDKYVNLEQEKLPFPDRSFDCVICTDVLEHLSNFHEIFEELLRVSNRYVLLSLPNNLDIVTRLRFLFDRRMRFYGLPVDPPDDRHKWLFSYRQADTFIRTRAQKNNFRIVYSAPSFPTSIFIQNPVSRFLQFIAPQQYSNLFAKAYWCLIEK